MPRGKELPNRIREWRHAREISQQKLADMAKTTKGQINKLETGQRRLTDKWMERLAPHLGVEPSALMRSSMREISSNHQRHGQLPPPKVAPKRIHNEGGHPISDMGISELDLGRRDLPVLGVAQGGRDGILMIPAEQAAVDMTYRPPQLAGVRDAFAVFAYDDSMAPMYRHGQTLWIYPNAPIRVDDGVLVIKTDDHALVKQLVRRTEKAVFLREYSPKRREFAVLVTDIRSIYRIIGALDPIR